MATLFLCVESFFLLCRNGPPHIRDIIGQQQTQSPSLNLGLLNFSNCLYR